MTRKPALLLAAAALLLSPPGLGQNGLGGDWSWDLPPGLPVPRVPAGNPMSEAKVVLGERLFSDRRLSGNGTQSCADCHRPESAFTDGRAQALGSTGELHPRSSMSLVNVAYAASLTWADASITSLEEQMTIPMFNRDPVELGLAGREEEIEARLTADPEYPALFRAAFPERSGEIDLDLVRKAIAAYERTLLSADSAWDRWVYRDDRSGMTESAIRGSKLFFSERLGCSGCHAGFQLSGPVDYVRAPESAPTFHHTGLYDVDGDGGYPSEDRGLMDATGDPEDMGKFRAPTLRNITLTAPYMHDGSLATLEEVLEHYAAGGRAKSRRTSELLRPFELSEREAADVIAFLAALTDPADLLEAPGDADGGLGTTEVEVTETAEVTRQLVVDAAPATVDEE